jgi:hypothetical protein
MNSFAEMGIYTVPGGGAVFSGGATGWTLALQDDTVSRITRNVLDKFISGNVPQEPDNENPTYLFHDRFNCYDIGRNRFTSNKWAPDVHELNYFATAGTAADKYTASCGVSGTGLSVKAISKKKGHRYQTHLKTNWETTEQLATSVYVNLAQLKLTEGNWFNLIEHYADNGQIMPFPMVELQIGRINGQLVARYQPAGESLPWVVVPEKQTFHLQVWWDQTAGLVGLWVDGEGSTYSVNSSGMQPFNRSDMGVMGVHGKVSGSFCLDELIYDDKTPDWLK